MQLQGISATPYGPQMACCKSAEEAANSAAIGGTGPACDPNCSGDDSTQKVLERMQTAIDALTHDQVVYETAQGSEWFTGVSNSTVILAGVGIAAVLLLRRRN